MASAAPHLPRVIVNMAMSLDGKVSSRSREPVTFTSREDRRHLLRLRARADAIVIGAGTASIDRQTLGIPDPGIQRQRQRRGIPPHPLRIIVSGRLSLSPRLKLLHIPISPLLFVCTKQAPVKRQRLFAKMGCVLVCGRREVDLPRLLEILAADCKVKTLVCEGGPTLNDAFFRAGLVDELFVTLLPCLVGGTDAPTLAEGRGFSTLKQAARGRLISLKQGCAECFLRYRFA
ncbi:MAG: dihydrofolate reductase family protein [Verrucomicrobiae bacterium]|nr:dihydrofolate reductase family protein [Verrucomicrobiae bacterium]